MRPSCWRSVFYLACCCRSPAREALGRSCTSSRRGIQSACCLQPPPSARSRLWPVGGQPVAQHVSHPLLPCAPSDLVIPTVRALLTLSTERVAIPEARTCIFTIRVVDLRTVVGGTECRRFDSPDWSCASWTRCGRMVLAQYVKFRTHFLKPSVRPTRPFKPRCIASKPNGRFAVPERLATPTSSKPWFRKRRLIVASSTNY